MLWRQGKAYSEDLRERVLAEADEGAKVGEIATLLRVGISYVSTVLSRSLRNPDTATLLLTVIPRNEAPVQPVAARGRAV